MPILNGLFDLFINIPLFVQYILLPLCLLAFIALFPFKSKLAALLVVIPTGLFLSLLYFSAVWEMSGGFYARYVLVGLFFAAAVLAFFKARKAPFFRKPKWGVWILYGFGLFAVIVLGIFNVNIFRAYSYKEEPIRLQFPFRDGTYLINDAGDGSVSNLVNYHYQDAENIRLNYYQSERFANDIVMIDDFGFEGRNFGNEESLEDYYVFGVNVYSPCDGLVYEVQEGYDNVPLNGTITDTGNGVAILTGDVYVVLWHLEKDSIVVQEGDYVHAGDLIGTIGNSGITVTPHLHIHAARGHFMNGEGVPVLYDGREPMKNTLFKEN
ncbi:MAG: M23 family metallopeptidase [Clostridiaceae bacterium]|jgi:hypothetical protein|nr:M23 family metallopeptidase [Clostridiaceae bacterium]